MYPLEGVESAALLSETGEAFALRLRWQPNLPGPAAAEGGAAPHAAASLQIGQLSAAYVPGLATCFLDFFAASTSLDLLGALQGSSEADSGSRSGDSSQPCMHPPSGGMQQQPPAWLTGGATLACSVLSLQLAALTHGGAGPAAVQVSAARASAHLGLLRAAARPGSLAAEMFAQLEQPPAGQGLRVAVVGAQLGIVTAWQHAQSRQGVMDTAAAGARHVCQPVELQAVACIVQGAASAEAAGERSGQPSSAEGPASTSYLGIPTPGSSVHTQGRAASQIAQQQDLDSVGPAAAAAANTWCGAAAASGVRLRLHGAELAAAMAVVDGLTAELARGFRGPFPKAGFPERSCAAPGPSTAGVPCLACLDISTASLQLLWCPIGVKSIGASLPEDADSSAAALLRCASACITAAVLPPGDDAATAALPALMLTLVQPHASFGRVLHAALPAADIRIAKVRMDGQQQAAEALGPPIAMLIEVALEHSSPQVQNRSEPLSTAPSLLSLSVQSVSLALALEQTTALVGGYAHIGI